MKQARRWLLISSVLVLLPSLALAEAKKPAGGGKKPVPQAPAKPAGAAAATGPTEIELDDTPKPEPSGAAGAATPASPSGAGGGGICEIDPSACPKELDIAAVAQRDVNAEVYAVQQIYALRNHRFEIQPYWSFTLNDQFVSHPGPGLGLNYYITNVLAVGINGNWYQGLNIDSDFNFETRRATRIGVPLNEYQWNGNLNFTYVPMYGKFAGFSNFIFHYDAYIVGGVGAISTRPIPVIDPDNRSFQFKTKVAFNAGLGLRIFVNRWLAANLEVRDYIFNEELENIVIARPSPAERNQSTWYGENRLTNNVQAQLGISVFLPFSWDYKLPK